jgi:hypothetical protein
MDDYFGFFESDILPTLLSQFPPPAKIIADYTAPRRQSQPVVAGYATVTASDLRLLNCSEKPKGQNDSKTPVARSSKSTSQASKQYFVNHCPISNYWTGKTRFPCRPRCTRLSPARLFGT